MEQRYLARKARKDWSYEDFISRFERTAGYRQLRGERLEEQEFRRALHWLWSEHLRAVGKWKPGSSAFKGAPLPRGTTRQLKAFQRRIVRVLDETERLFGERPQEIARWYWRAEVDLVTWDVDRLYRSDYRTKKPTGAKRDPATDAMAKLEKLLTSVPASRRYDLIARLIAFAQNRRSIGGERVRQRLKDLRRRQGR